MTATASDTRGADVWTAPAADGPVRGAVWLPGSKSLTNRALVLAALADGPSTVIAPLRARDTALMVEGLNALGAQVTDTTDGDWAVVPGPLAVRAVTVDCGLAGTVARFLPPLATLGHAPVTFDGDTRMRERPMGSLLAALADLGASVDGTRLPVTVTGPASGGEVIVDASASSQLVSGLLLVGASLPGGLTVRHVGPPAVSAHHIHMTVALLVNAGVRVDDSEPDRWTVSPGPVHAADLVVEPDLSTSSAFLAAAAVTGGVVTIPGWPKTSTQPGTLMPELLAAMGARSELTDAGLTLHGPDRLLGLTADLRDVPELALTLAAVATLAETPSRLTGIAHLRLQESDRLAAFATELGRLGARVRERPDGFDIDPAPLASPPGVVLDPHADHRLAMAYAVIGLRVAGVRISDIATTGKTVPDFAGRWAQLVHPAPGAPDVPAPPG